MQEKNVPAKGPENVCAMELEKCLSVGMEAFLDTNPGHQSSKRFPTRLRGWESGRYIILGLSSDSPVPVVRQGKECVIRFIHEGEVWGFTALFAEQIVSGGYPLFQLYWPSEVARVQVRKHERVAIQTPCTAELEDDSIHQAIISDLSGGGCSLLLDHDVAVGASMRLSFRMPDGGKVDKRPVIVRNRKSIPGRGIKYGCQFQAAQVKDHGIELFVARKIAVERGESAPHRQILVLSRNEADIELAQQTLASDPYEVVEASGIIDLGHRLHTCNAAAILISAEQKEISAVDVLTLIRNTPGLDKIPLFLYGDGSTHDKAVAAGATSCLRELSEARTILSHLPAPPVEAPAATPATSPDEATSRDVVADSPGADAGEPVLEDVEDDDDDDDEIKVEG